MRKQSILDMWWDESQQKRRVTADYNGWPNYETWNVALWMSNNEALYRKQQDFIHKWGAKLDAGQTQAFVRWMFPNGTPDMKGPEDLDKVDWEELASNWREESKE